MPRWSSRSTRLMGTAMTDLKTVLLFVLTASYAAVLAHWIQEKKTLRNELAAIEAAEHQRNKAIGILATEYYERLKDIESRPAPEPERVFVKASCVSPTGAARLDDGAKPGRVELDPGTVGRITAISDKWQRDFERCSVKLEAIQEALRTK